MTIKEIADLCGVDQPTVWRWTQNDNLLQNAKGLAEKLEQAKKSGKDPADFTLDETLDIIGKGGGNKTLAALLAENAANKNALAVQNAPGIVELMKNLYVISNRVLEDPKKAVYEELENFVQKNLEVDEKRIYKVPVWHLYHAYTKAVDNPINQHDFMFKIALDHPEFELRYMRKEGAFVRCCTKFIM